MYRPVHAVRTWIMNIEVTGSALESITSGESEYHPTKGNMETVRSAMEWSPQRSAGKHAA